jgi:FlaA1/EpsC-like NDP-sugar epimerase
MTTDTNEALNIAPAPRARWWLVALGVVPIIGGAMLAVRIIWEETALTAAQGPQMVGFSLAHGSGAVLLFAPILLVLWIVVALVLMVVNRVKKRKTDTPTRVTFAVAVALFALLMVPSRFWQRLYIRQMAASPRAGDLLVYAAYSKDLGMVKALLAHGVKVQEKDHRDWKTALHAAASVCDARTIEFLLSQGADVNALDRAGDSPAESATENEHQQCVALLQHHGGTVIRGTEAQHDQASQDKVREDIEEMDRLRRK